MDIQTKLYVIQNIYNDLVVIRKNKVTSTLNKPAYTGMCILELNNLVFLTNNLN